MLRTACLALASITLVSACSDSSSPSDTPPPATASVTATTSQQFSPSTVRVATNGTVTWVFQSLGHNVTFDDVAGAPEDIGGVNSNTSIARTFSSNGTFRYHCTIHPGMAGTVQVSSASSPAATGSAPEQNSPTSSGGDGALSTGY